MKVYHGTAPIQRGTLQLASPKRTVADERDDLEKALEYLKENPDADFTRAYTARYDQPYKESVKAASQGPMRLNVAVMLALAATHRIPGHLFGGFTGIGLTALGGLELAEGLKREDSFMTKAGLFNVAIGLTAVAAPFTPGYPWVARLAPLGLAGIREVWIRHHQKNEATFSLPPNPNGVGNPVSVASVVGPAATGPKPTSQTERVERALGNLSARGWTFQTLRGHEGYLNKVAPAQALSYLTGKRDTALRSGDRLLLLEPGHQDFSQKTWHHVVDLEGVTAVDFFHGSGEPEVLSDPELATSLKSLAQMGVEMSAPHPRYRFHRPEVAAYLGYQRNHHLSMKLDELPLGAAPLTADQVKDLDTLTGLNPEQRRAFLQSRLVGASVEEALAQFREPVIDVEMEENTLTIGGFTVEVN